ncbi:MAG: glutamate mutase L, partial [Firmicutes bacterium]|nr:glutamate mutase L [Bacillota bacterium]
LARIKEINPNLILIAGGVDFGERDTAIYNAEMIRTLGLKTPVVYAGNIENQDEMKLIFDEESGQFLYLVDNVYPKIDTLNVEPCRKVIQDAFEDHITHAPGMEHVRDMVNGPIIPTPGAVMECTKLLYDCIGDVMTIDVGGATTDVHAVTEDSDAVARVLTAPEPKAKRTVEGDLGVYVNRMKVIESIGEEKLREECETKLGIDLDKTLETYVAIPKTEDEFKLVERLTKEAVLRAVERHAGQIRYVYGPSGRQTLAEGKDLTQVKYIVGTGGALTRLPHRVEIMSQIPKDNLTGMKLYPGDAVKILVDNDYIMASLGVLSKTHREGAIRLLSKSLGIPLCEREVVSSTAKFVEELQRMTTARKEKEEERARHIKEMEEQGFDLTEYKEAMAEKIGGATAEEVAAAKAEAMKVAEAKSEPADDYDPKAHVMRACGEVDGRPNCNRDCKHCMRKHCPYRQE